MEKRCISLKFLIISFFFLLYNRPAISIAVEKFKKDNHTIKDLRKIHDQKTSSSRFNYRMHGLHSLFNNGPDQMKPIYTNLDSGDNQVQLKYITGTGLLSPLIVRASDLGLVPDQNQMANIPALFNDFNNLNQPNQFMMRPEIKNENQFSNGPLMFSHNQNGRTKAKRHKRKRKKPFFKFNDQDSTEFAKTNSMEFSKSNSMEFPNMNVRHNLNKKSNNFEKSYDELVHSAIKMADAIENFSDNENLESEDKDKKFLTNYENDKFNFDDEMKLNHKDEDELENSDKLQNLSSFADSSSNTGKKKNTNADNFNDFDSIEKNSYTSSDQEKLSDVFNESFKDLFKDNDNDNDKDSKYSNGNDEDDKLESYDKLYDKIIGNIAGDKKKNKKNNEDKYIPFSEDLFEEKKKPPAKKRKKPQLPSNVEEEDNTTTGGQLVSNNNNNNENTKDEESTNNKEQDETKTTNENEQTEYNTNTSGHVETGEYDYAGYAKDPNEQSEEAIDTEPENTPEKNTYSSDKGSPNDNGGNENHEGQQITNPTPENKENYTKENHYNNQPPPPANHQHKTDDHAPPPSSPEQERSFKNPPTSFRKSFQPFTRLSAKNVKNVKNIKNFKDVKDVKNSMNKLNTSNGFNKSSSKKNQFNYEKPIGQSNNRKKRVRVRSKRINYY